MRPVLRKLLGASLLCALSSLAIADVAVIVHPSNGDAMTKEDIQKIYLGKTKTFPGGKDATAYDQTEGSAIRVEFLGKVVDKDEAQMKAFWSRLIFTGKGVPPKIVANDAEVKAAIKGDPNGIGFVDVISVDDSVKVVATF